VSDFLEIHGYYDENTAREQAARCVQCPEPSCVAGCPLHSDIPEWLRLTAEGQFLEAATLVRREGAMREICAEVCPSDRLCEGVCILEGRAEAVSIGAIEQFLTHYALEHDGAPRASAPPSGKRVAVIGSGPGGLACADELARRGHSVSVFDKRIVPGGLLVRGVPTFKLENTLVQRRIDIMRRRGVEFRLGEDFGTHLGFAPLKEGFDAAYLSCGSRQAREPTFPGAHLFGVEQALPFVVAENSRVPVEIGRVEVKGERVCVIGAGNLALDCARTAIRRGAASVTCVYRRDEAAMSCSRRDYLAAVEEGVRFVFRSLPVALLDRGDGRVGAIRLVRTEPSNDPSTAVPAFLGLPGTECELAVDRVFAAMGFDPLPLPEVEPYGSLSKDPRGRIVTDETGKTSVPGIFAGGDMVRGPVPVLEAPRGRRHRRLAPHALNRNRIGIPGRGRSGSRKIPTRVRFQSMRKPEQGALGRFRGGVA
jgi:glutamate synthase (NADPH/NADH) small chain